MSYSTRIDEMVASHIAQYQAEQMLAKILAEQPHTVPMPHGYPKAIYHPRGYSMTPKVQAFIAHTGGRVSNGVPWLLGMELVNGYVLGAYSPANDGPPERDAA